MTDASARLGWPARLYLLHAALLTASLAIFSLFFNITILALGFSLDFLGVLTSTAFAASALLGAPLLWLLGRLPLRLALIGGALLQCAGVLLLALWPAEAALLVASVILGAGAVLFDISAAPFMMQHSDGATRDRLFSANTGIRIGLAGLGSLVAGGLPALAVAWLGQPARSAPAYQATMVLAAAGILLSITPLLLLGGARVAAARSPGRALATAEAGPADVWRALLRQPGPLLRLLASPALISAGAALLIPYLNLFFTQRFAVADQTLGLIFAGLGVCTGLATLAAPALARRMGRLPTIVLTEALAIPFLLLLGWAPMLGLAVGAALGRAALFNMGAPLYDAFAMERTPAAARPTVIALLNGAYGVGYLFGPLISVQIQARYGFGPIFAITAACYLVGVWLKYWFFLRGSGRNSR